jgi:hypothetical protein
VNKEQKIIGFPISECKTGKLNPSISQVDLNKLLTKNENFHGEGDGALYIC